MTEQKITAAQVPNEILALKNGRELAYAENRSQSPAYIYCGGSNNPLAISKFKVVSGDPSFIVMADLSQLISIMCLMSEAFRRSFGQVPFIAIAGKHGNPCGAAIDWDNPATAVRKALFGDPVAVMGGEFVANFPLTNGPLSDLLLYSDKKLIGRDRWGLDLIATPGFTQGAIDLLGERKQRRLLANSSLIQTPYPQEEWTYRELHGGDWLKQRAPRFVLSPSTIIDWTMRERLTNNFRNKLMSNLIIAFACAWRASSNSVALTKDNMLIGLGCGQQDRMACARLCLDRANRAGHNVKRSVFASDGFFPFATSEANSANEIKRLMSATEKLHARLIGKSGHEKIILLNNLTNLVGRLDRREGPELLADAGCIGGVVPADGKRLEEVKKFFENKNMSVAFVAAENRGFSKH